MNKLVALCAMVTLSSCASIRYEYLYAQPDLTSLTPEEKTFYEENKRHVPRRYWAEWIYATSPDRKVSIRRKIDGRLDERKTANAKQEYFGCAKIRDQDLEPNIYIQSATEREECRAEHEYNHSFAFPRISIDRKTKVPSYVIYVQFRASDWYFLASYAYKVGTELFTGEVSVIDREVESGSKVREDVFFTIPEKHFEFFSRNEMRLRASGTRGQIDLKIPGDIFSDVSRIHSDWRANRLKY